MGKCCNPPYSLGQWFPTMFLKLIQHCSACMSHLSNTPDSGKQLIRRDSKTQTVCVSDKGAVLGLPGMWLGT